MADEDFRKYRLKMKPRPQQIEALEKALVLHQRLYNAALEERITFYERTKEKHLWIKSWQDHIKTLKKKNDKKAIAFFDEKINAAREEINKIYWKYRPNKAGNADKRIYGVSYYSQNYSVKPICADDPDYKALSSTSLELTLKRLDEAYQHFFRRVKEKKEKAGFPRFKGRDFFNSFDLKAPQKGEADKLGWPGWKMEISPSGKSGRLYIKGITPKGAAIPLRGRLKYPPALEPQDFEDERKAPVKNATVRRDRAGGWELTVTLDCTGKIKRHAQGEPVAFDWGCRKESFLTTHENRRVESPKYLLEAKREIRRRQRVLSRREKKSKRRRAARVKLAWIHAKVARQRREFVHEESARLVAGAGGFIATEKLNLRNMTRTARGTKEKPGKNVKQKAGLNRSILDAAPGMFLRMVSYKAAEAGLEYVELGTSRLKPSQTCPRCGHQEKKSLAQRRHVCAKCSYQADRDHAAAQIIMQEACRQRKGGVS